MQEFNKPKILVFSHNEFDEFCENHKLNDNNVEECKDFAFISIIGTDACMRYWLEDISEHYFKEEHNNVCNVEFDDISEDVEYNGYIFKAITDEQADKIIQFIEDNLGKTFVIHCRAGKSRSQGVFKAITDTFFNLYTSDCGRAENPCINPNIAVVASIKRAYYRKHEMFGSDKFER